MLLRRVIGIGVFAVVLVGGTVAAYAVTDNDVTATFSGSKNGQGYYTSPVTVSFSGTDASETCTPSETVVSGSNKTETISSTCGPGGDPTQARTGTFEVSVDDPPSFNPPSEIVREADVPAEPGFPGGARVEKPSAAGSATVTCDPPWPGLFPIGSDVWSCVATDDSTGVSSDSQPIRVTVQDTTPPVIQPSNPPDITLEAQGPHGFRSATGAYDATVFTASDTIDGNNIPVLCLPAPESTFALDRSEQVTCTATDAHNQTASVRFNATVRDTIPPTLNVTPPITVQAQSAAGTARNHNCISRFLAEGASATDDVDQSVTITHEGAPPVFPIGTTEVRFTAKDDSSHSPAAAASGFVIVKRGPQGACVVDPDPPPDPRRARAGSLNRQVKLTWRNPGARDFDHVLIFRSRTTADSNRRRVYKGSRERFLDRRVRNNVQYRYDIVSVDWHGNRSNGAMVYARPHRIVLLRPREGARISRPPTFVWVTVSRARRYSLQLYRLGPNSTLRRILTTYPRRAQYTLPSSWRYDGQRRRLSPGRYYWYVWPWFGTRYGKPMGPGDFTFVRRR